MRNPTKDNEPRNEMSQADSLELMEGIGPQYVQIGTHSVSIWLRGRCAVGRSFPLFPSSLTESHIMASRAILVRLGARTAMHALLVVGFPRY